MCGVNVRVDRLVRLEVEGNLLFLAFVCEDRSDEKNEAVWRYSVVQLQSLLGGGDGSKDGKTVDSRFDVGRSTVFLRQHSRYSRDLILW